MKRPAHREMLEHIVMQHIRGSHLCSQLTSVKIVHVPDGDPNWRVQIFDPGAEDPVECERALDIVVPPLQDTYDLAA